MPFRSSRRLLSSVAACLAALSGHAGERIAVPDEFMNPPKVTPRIPGASSCEPIAGTSATDRPSLVLGKVSPAAGSMVTRKTAVVASITYHIPSYSEGQYRLTAQFETTTPGMTFDGSFPNVSYPKACGPGGIFSIYFPLEHMWDIRAIKRPIRMIFYLLEGPGPVTQVVAATEWIEFRTE